MQNCKEIISRFSFLHFTYLPFILMLSLGMSACTLPKPEASGTSIDTSASFLVESVEAKVIESKNIANFSVPASKVFHFIVCLKDLKQSKPILNHRFAVSGADKELVLGTDAKGCLQWDESIAYNHFSEARFVRTERKIQARGMHKGERLTEWALNPWEDIAVDLSSTKINNLAGKDEAQATLQTYNNNKKTILITDIQVTVVEKSNSASEGQSIDIELRGQPVLEFRKSSGLQGTEIVNEGRFKVKVHLIQSLNEGSKTIRRDIYQSEIIPINTAKGFISLKIPATIKELCSRGQYILGLEMTADLPSPYQLKKFEGTYVVANCDQLKGSFFSRLSKDSLDQGNDFSIAKFVENDSTPQKQQNQVALPAQPPGSLMAGYTATELEATPVDNKESQGIQRRIGLKMKICLTSNTGAPNPVGYQFRVNKLDSSVAELAPYGQTGCLIWEDSYAYNYLERECERDTKIHIENANLKISTDISLRINPWKSQVRDLNVNKQLALKPVACAAGQSQIIPQVIEFKKSSMSYSVDPFLNLMVRKTGIIDIPFTIQRPTLTLDGSGVEKIDPPLGKYLMRYALLKNETNLHALSAKDILMVSEQVVESSSRGKITSSIAFESTQLKEIAGSSLILVSFSPIETSNPLSNFDETVYQGNYNMADNGDAVGLLLMPGLSGKKLMSIIKDIESRAKQESLQKLKILSNKETFIKEFQLSVANANQLPTNKADKTFGLTSETLKAMVNQEQLTSEAALDLCTFWLGTVMPLNTADRFFRQSEISKCQNLVRTSPLAYFDFQARSFVNQPKVTAVQQGVFRDFAINVGFSMAKSQSQSESTSRSVDAGGGISIKFPSWLTLGFVDASVNSGVRAQASWADSSGTQVAAQMSTNTQITTTVEAISLKIKAQAEKCIMIKVKPEVYLSDRWKSHLKTQKEDSVQNAKLRSIDKGIAVCEGQQSTNTRDFVETYFVINQKNASGILLDAHAESNRAFFIGIRGASDFVSFLSFLQIGMGMPETFKADFVNREFIKDRTKAFFMKGMPGSPGQIIHAR